MSELSSENYSGFLIEIKARIRAAQYDALRAVNTRLVRLYWDIEEAIHRKQETLDWVKSVVETLARDLQSDFPGRNEQSPYWCRHLHRCARTSRTLPRRTPQPRRHRRTLAPLGWKIPDNE